MAVSSSTKHPRFSIVVGLKYTDGGAFAVDQAARIARSIPSASVHLVHVFPKPISFEEAQSAVEHLKLYEREKVASLGGLDGRTIGVHVRSGDIAREIVQLATDVVASLIVVGATERSITSLLSTPIVEQVMALAACPVLVAGPKAPTYAGDPPTTIEPPCADCLSTRATTSGQSWWCERHSAHAAAAHTYSYSRDLPFETKDSNLGPTGV